jgi:hypothetical protein
VKLRVWRFVVWPQKTLKNAEADRCMFLAKLRARFPNCVAILSVQEFRELPRFLRRH